ncbi:Putative exonuclease, RdgC [Desulfocicer vacuolatum DSM 3385]|uniref:Putative exonuclease, RdgC n=1 Tax=Desulfocicer vacuolatum DSM 3385 TaxID=1121400 RepID=A0A1W2CB07_9BACT|nr:recombination-associated protein RdgC [Desulfocicer vacuolatum]SMC82052.1 Putative exonuclease, RdgC [Desulfocicer vacuolatum DSM 3385]
MGLLSSSVSIARYRVEGKFESSILESVRNGLTKNIISQIEDEYAEISVGWTPLESEFDPDFEKFSFSFGTYFVFSLRIDKKSVPSKIIKKHVALEVIKKLKETHRDFLSKNEKKDIKDLITEKLMRQMPSTPNTYDVMWDYENATVLFFSTQKAANEELETLFKKSFQLKLIRLFPFTMIENSLTLKDEEKDLAANLASTKLLR